MCDQNAGFVSNNEIAANDEGLLEANEHYPNENDCNAGPLLAGESLAKQYPREQYSYRAVQRR
jgi:hypothetical protein